MITLISRVLNNDKELEAAVKLLKENGFQAEFVGYENSRASTWWSVDDVIYQDEDKEISKEKALDILLEYESSIHDAEVTAGNEVLESAVMSKYINQSDCVAQREAYDAQTEILNWVIENDVSKPCEECRNCTIELENRTLVLTEDEIWKIYRYQERKFHEQDVVNALENMGVIEKITNDDELIKQITDRYEDALDNDHTRNDFVADIATQYVDEDDFEK